MIYNLIEIAVKPYLNHFKLLNVKERISVMNCDEHCFSLDFKIAKSIHN